MRKWSIPTEYNGTRYRSKLEAAWARFFDAHRMKFAYEPEGFDFDGVRYLPDFWLPEIRTVVEVKGLLDETDMEKLTALAEHAAPRGILVILAEAPAGERFRIVLPSPQAQEEFGGVQEEVSLSRCRQCGRWYFRDEVMSWHCTACGFHDGDRTFDLVHGAYANEKCPDCGR